MTAKRIGVQSVAVRDIVAPGEIKERMRSPRVLAMAESLTATGGESMEPIVLARDLSLVAGRDRYAAYLVRGTIRADAVVYDGTPDELSELTHIENAHRRHDSAEKANSLAWLVEHAKRRILATDPPREKPAPEEGKAPRGRPSSAIGKAITEVAQQTGTPVRQVARAVADGPAKSGPSGKPSISTWGLDVPQPLIDGIQDRVDFLSAMRKEVSDMIRALTEHNKARDSTEATPQDIREALLAASAAIIEAMPAAICVWCKLTKYQAECTGCHGTGYLSARDMRHGIDDKLRLVGAEAGIYRSGKFVLLKDV